MQSNSNPVQTEQTTLFASTQRQDSTAKSQLFDWILQMGFKIIILTSIIYVLLRTLSLSHQEKILRNAIIQLNQQNNQSKGSYLTTWDQLIDATSLAYPSHIQFLQKTRQRRKQGVDLNIQIGSQLDYLKINESISFKIFKQNFLRLAPHEILSFQFNQSLEKSLSKLEYKHFKSEQQIQQYLKQISQASIFAFFHDNIQAHLAENLQWKFQQPGVLEAQYYYMNKKHKFQHIEKQQPICLISTGYKIFTKNKYIQFFQSIQRQNYSNYQVVIVDDFSPDDSARHFHQHLASTDYRLKNRLKIVHTLKNIGALANMYIWVRKYCLTASIVVNVDSDDALIGAQAFNVINAQYQDPNVWFLYTNFLWQSGFNQSILVTPNDQFKTTAKTYRARPIWVTSHLRTYRQQLMENSPVEHYVQYRYNEASKRLEPTFHLSSADRFQVYTHLQLSGNSRIKYITDFLYYYQMAPASKITCYRQFEIYQEFKSRAKIPLIPLANLNQNPLFQQQPLDNYVYNGLETSYNNYMDCKNQKFNLHNFFRNIIGF